MRATGFILGGVACALFAAADSNAQTIYKNEFDRALRGVLSNIQFNGAIIASPSLVEPNYYYDWVRDSSVTMKTIVTLAYDSTTQSSIRSSLLPRIERWIDWELRRQLVPKIADLGEPRFYISGSANNEDWGRPQNDGPALRAITAMLVANHWIDEGRLSEVSQRLYRNHLPSDTLIKRDLEYVAHHWSEPSVDLWEEEKGMHFYTLTVQKVALIKGAELANRLGDAGAAVYYKNQALAIEQYLKHFYDASSGTLRYAIDSNKAPQKYTDLDISVVLAAIQTFDGQFYVPIDQVVRTVDALIARFQVEYPINQMTRDSDGIALGVSLGRYPGDIYSGFGFGGGNPWFLSTLALAEFYCDINKAQYHTKALAQFNRVIHHMNEDGDLSEQFNRNTGFEQGARDLTWSYTSYLTAYRACF